MLQFSGSWYPQVPLRYRGWKKPVKPVSVPFHQRDVWLALKRFCQFPLEARYVWCSAVLFILAAICAMQKSSYAYSSVREMLRVMVPVPALS